jgi:DNA-binding CsgD family transcriptional regulator
MNDDELQRRITERGHRLRDRLMDIQTSHPPLSAQMMGRLFRAFKMLDEPIDLEHFPARALAAAKCLFGADFFWYGEIDTARMRASAVFDSSGSYVDTWSRYMLDGPVLSHWEWPEPGFAAKISDYVSQPELHRTDIYEWYLRPFGNEYCLCAPLLRTPSLIVSIGADRQAHDFSEEHRCALMLLSLYLSQCRRLCESSSIARAQQPILRDDLSVTQVEIVVVGSDGRVRSMSSRGAEFIQRYVGPFPRLSPRLPAQLGDHIMDMVRKRSSLDFRDPTSPGSSLEVFAMNDGAEVSLYLRHHEPLANETLARALGTTPRRAAVGRYLCRGKTREEIANELGISSGTVRKHVEDLYSTLKVSGRDKILGPVEAVNEIRRRVAEYLRQRGDG